MHYQKLALLLGFLCSPAFATNFRVLASDSKLFHPLRKTVKPLSVEGPEGCRAQIEEKMCLVDPVEKGKEDEARICIEDVDLSRGARELEFVYDAYPPLMREVFCSIDVIYVERDFIGTAYAGSDKDTKKIIMGIRESALIPENSEAPMSMSQWITWKEQLSFGGDSEGYPNRNDLVRVNVEMDLTKANDFLFFVIAHEFGHLLDFAKQLNSFDCRNPDSESGLCPPTKGSWTEFSWKSVNPNYPFPNPETDPWGLMRFELKPAAQFNNRDQLCFYACAKDHGSPELMPSLYESLQNSNLLTTYSTTNPRDDFAESLAFYAGAHFSNMSYSVQLPSGEVFDLMEKYKSSELFREKREFLERLFQTH